MHGCLHDMILELFDDERDGARKQLDTFLQDKVPMKVLTASQNFASGTKHSIPTSCLPFEFDFLYTCLTSVVLKHLHNFKAPAFQFLLDQFLELARNEVQRLLHEPAAMLVLHGLSCLCPMP